MFKAIKNWFIQKYLKLIVRHQHVYSQVLFDYANGNWEEMVAGPGDERTSGLVDVFLNQLVNSGRDQIIVAIIHTYEDGGYVLAMTSDRHYCERWFIHGIHEMAEAFVDVSLWCKQENDNSAVRRKELLL